MAGSPSGSALWFRSFHPSPDAETRLICLPHAVGSASSFFWLSRALSPEIEVLAVQYPGRQDRHREQPVGDIHELADRVLGALEGSLDRPFAFFGHSMGALIAFETALRLAQRAGRRPLRLFASSRRAPSRRGGEVLDFNDDASLIARLRELGGTNKQFLADPELLATVLPVARGDYRAVETYAGDPDASVDCPVTALVGDRDPQTTIDDASAWEGHTSAEFELRVFPGGHFFLDAHQAEVADTVLRALKR